jgi:hypothetical protein
MLRLLQKICPRPTLSVTIFNMVIFYGERLLAPCPNPKLENYSLLVVHNCLFHILDAILQIWRPPHPSAN